MDKLQRPPSAPAADESRSATTHIPGKLQTLTVFSLLSRKGKKQVTYKESESKVGFHTSSLKSRIEHSQASRPSGELLPSWNS